MSIPDDEGTIVTCFNVIASMLFKRRNGEQNREVFVSPRRFIAINAVMFAVVALLVHQVVGWGVLVEFDRAAIRLARRVAPSRDYLLITDKLALRGFILATCLPLMAYLARRERSWIPVGSFLLVLLFETGMTGSLKVAVGRSFPYQRRIALETDSLAFPSGHATNAAALWGFVLWYVTDSRRDYRRAAVVAFGSILVIAGATSWLLRTHWPSDLAAGYAIGAIAAITVAAMLCAAGMNPAARMVEGVLNPGARSPRPPEVRRESLDVR